MIAVIAIEYILFKKIGPKMAKYANLVDVILLVIFIGDWIMNLILTFHQIEHTDPPTFQVTSIYGFIGFSYRTLLVTLTLYLR